MKGKIKLAIAEQFGIDPLNLYLTSPTFFSRLTNVTAKNVHDEYWHEHVDKVRDSVTFNEIILKLCHL